jgi:hypothetical protein
MARWAFFSGGQATGLIPFSIGQAGDRLVLSAMAAAPTAAAATTAEPSAHAAAAESAAESAAEPSTHRCTAESAHPAHGGSS